MTCDICKEERHKLRNIGDFKYACKDCIGIPIPENGTFLISKIVTFHDSEGKPIKATEARINMIKRRYLSPEDGVTVLEKDMLGRKRDKKAVVY